MDGSSVIIKDKQIISRLKVSAAAEVFLCSGFLQYLEMLLTIVSEADII